MRAKAERDDRDKRGVKRKSGDAELPSAVGKPLAELQQDGNGNGLTPNKEKLRNDRGRLAMKLERQRRNQMLKQQREMEESMRSHKGRRGGPFEPS